MRLLKIPALVALAGLFVLAGCDLLGGNGQTTDVIEVPTYEITGGGIAAGTADTLATELGTGSLTQTEAGAIDYLNSDLFQSVPMKNAVDDQTGAEEGEGTYTPQSFDFAALDSVPTPMGADAALSKAQGALQNSELAPSNRLGGEGMTQGEEFTVSRSTSNSTFQLYDADSDSMEHEIDLDTKVSYRFELSAGDRLVPLIGEGSKVQLVFDGNENTTRVLYSLRSLAAGGSVEIISQDEAVQTGQRIYEGELGSADDREGEAGQAEVSLGEVNAELVYVAPGLHDSNATTVYPYYRASASATIGGETVQLRDILIDAMPNQEAPYAYGSQTSSGALGGSLAPAANKSYIEVGTEWIGESQGLGGSKDNAGGFADTFGNNGYPVDFEWGNQSAWEQDFKAPSVGGTDDSWVDEVDALFYTGHAGANGFTFPSSQDDGFLHFNEASTTGTNDGWGSTDLEWLVIAACGPLQKNNGNNDAWYDRWGDAFDGLHMMMAYANVSRDNVREGTIYANALINGKKVREAWIKAATKVQPSSVTYAIMGVANSDGLTNYNDYLWGQGNGGGADIGPSDIYYYWRISGQS